VLISKVGVKVGIVGNGVMVRVVVIVEVTLFVGVNEGEAGVGVAAHALKNTPMIRSMYRLFFIIHLFASKWNYTLRKENS
jgi:hypothetical protein